MTGGGVPRRKCVEFTRTSKEGTFWVTGSPVCGLVVAKVTRRRVTTK